jgi:hypothetical protein
MGKLHQFTALSWREKWLHLKVALWLIAVKAGLCLLPFNRLRTWMARSSQPDGTPLDIKDMHTIILAIERISRFLTPLRINCLPQALVGHGLLRQKGFNVKLRIGVLKNPGDRLAAHAWLEVQGQVVLGNLRGLEQFAAFPALGGAQR